MMKQWLSAYLKDYCSTEGTESTQGFVDQVVQAQLIQLELLTAAQLGWMFTRQKTVDLAAEAMIPFKDSNDD